MGRSSESRPMTRNQKSEIRMSKSETNPKPGKWSRNEANQEAIARICFSSFSAFSANSSLFRISDFGFRIFDRSARVKAPR